MTTLPIPIDDATAEAFRDAPAETRERIALLVADVVRATVRPRDEQLEAFRKAADALGAAAQARGWNDELDAALLRGDLDDDE